MATRINTKFVVTLVSAIILLGVGLGFGYMYLKKTAADHVRLAEAAMERAEAALPEALATGDVEVYNTERERAANHYGSAKHKDPTNVAYLYGYVEAHEGVLCQTLTKASNQLAEILSGAAGIHDTIGANDEDRAVLYELLHEQARMDLIVQSHPIGVMNSYTTKRLDVAPDDPVARTYQAIAMSHFANERTTDEEALEDLAVLNAAAAAAPENAWLQAGLARYHLGNAGRIYRAKGNQVTEEVNAGFASAFDHASQALQLADNNMPAFIEAAGILAVLRSGDDALNQRIRQQQTAIARQLDGKLQDKANRDALFIEELGRAIAILRRVRPAAGEEGVINGPAQAEALAKTLVQERPEIPGAYQLLGSLQHETNQFEQAKATLDAGLAIDRLTNATWFVRDNTAREDMRSLLADTHITLAIRAEDSDQREAALEQAESVIDTYANMETTQDTTLRDARADYLRGRLLLVRNQPAQAVTLLERANQTYQQRDAKTLRLLAQTHTRLKTTGLVAGFYETIIANQLSPQPSDFLNLINVYMNPGPNQQLDKAQAQLERYREILPDDISAIRLQARLLALQDKPEEAMALLGEHLDDHPELANMIAGLQSQSGDDSAVIELLRNRIAQDDTVNLQLVVELLNKLPEAQAKQAELNRLIGEGLDAAVAQTLGRVLLADQPSLEDQLELIELTSATPVDAALKTFLLYQRLGQPEAAEPYLEQAATLAPDRPDVIEWRFRTALGDKRWPDAQAAIEAMLSLPENKRTPLALADGQFMRAQLLAAQAVAMDAGEARNKQLREAVLQYNSALADYSHYVEGWILLSRLYLAQGNAFAAQDSLNEALDRQGRNVQALELMGQALQASGDSVNALERFEQVLAIQPNHPTALDRFAALAQQTGRVDRAIALREQMQERAATNYNNRRALAMLYAQNDAPDQAVQSIQAVIEAEGQTAQNVAVLSEVLAANGAHTQAVQAIEDYLAALGDSAQWRDYLLLGQAHERAAQQAEADAALTKAIALEQAEGTFTAALFQAQLRLNRGEVAQAAELLESLITEFPEEQSLKPRAAALFLQLGQFDKAERIAEAMSASADRARLLIQSASAQEGKLQVAIDRAEQAAEAYPSDFSLQLLRVELLRNREDRLPEGERDYNALLTMARQLAEDYADRVEAQVALVDVLRGMKNREVQALATLENALGFAPRHLGVNQRMATLKLQQAESLASGNPEASRDHAREALDALEILLEARPDVPLLLRSAARASQLAGAGQDAVNYYRQTFEATQSAGDLLAYANVLIGTGQGVAARSVLDNGENATLLRSSLALRALRGRAIAASGQSESAATLFSNLLAQAQTPVDQQVVVEQVLLSFTNDPQRTISILEGALGQDLPARIDLALSLLLSNQELHEQVDERLAKYMASPADPATQSAILNQLALSRQNSSQFEQAKAAYESLFKLLEQNEELIPQSQQLQLFNNMAFLLADQLEGYETQAVDYAKQALALLPEGASGLQPALIRDTLGWAHFKAGQLEDAIEVLKQSVEDYPLIDNQLHLGRAYLASGDKIRASLALQKALTRARAEGNEEMVAEATRWYDEAR